MTIWSPSISASSIDYVAVRYNHYTHTQRSCDNSYITHMSCHDGDSVFLHLQNQIPNVSSDSRVHSSSWLICGETKSKPHYTVVILAQTLYFNYSNITTYSELGDYHSFRGNLPKFLFQNFDLSVHGN